MQKLKRNIVMKMLSARLTNAELDLILAISHYQHDNGVAYGVHYADVAQCAGFSSDTFYTALWSLKAKGLIDFKRSGHRDWDIEICGNAFDVTKRIRESYLSTGHDIFFNKDFLALKSNEKMIAMYFLTVKDYVDFISSLWYPYSNMEQKN